MKWFDKWFYKQTKKAWDSKDKYEKEDYVNRLEAKQMSIGMAQLERSPTEGEDRITFELTSAVGGRILNVRRYDNKQDRHNATTYVIPTGEDVGSRVAKILNLELLK